jgi:hypothetical protein
VRHNKANFKTQPEWKHSQFHKVIAVFASLYGCENWVLTERDKNRIQAEEMRSLRSTLEVTRHDRLSNEAIWKTLKLNSLNNTTIKYRHNWLNHITRMDHSRLLRYKLPHEPSGKRHEYLQPKKEMDKSELRRRNGQKPNA